MRILWRGEERRGGILLQEGFWVGEEDRVARSLRKERWGEVGTGTGKGIEAIFFFVFLDFSFFVLRGFNQG